MDKLCLMKKKKNLSLICLHKANNSVFDTCAFIPKYIPVHYGSPAKYKNANELTQIFCRRSGQKLPSAWIRAPREREREWREGSIQSRQGGHQARRQPAQGWPKRAAQDSWEAEMQSNDPSENEDLAKAPCHLTPPLHCSQ